MLDTINLAIELEVEGYGGVCLQTQAGSTGYHWVLPAMPNCINRTTDDYLPATPGPHPPGSVYVHVFVFVGVTKTVDPPEMVFYLVPPGKSINEAVSKAVCKVVVTG